MDSEGVPYLLEHFLFFGENLPLSLPWLAFNRIWLFGEGGRWSSCDFLLCCLFFTIAAFLCNFLDPSPTAWTILDFWISVHKISANNVLFANLGSECESLSKAVCKCYTEAGKPVGAHGTEVPWQKDLTCKTAKLFLNFFVESDKPQNNSPGYYKIGHFL